MELSAEEVFSNDKDPMDAIAELRRSESDVSADAPEAPEDIDNQDSSSEGSSTGLDDSDQTQEASQDELEDGEDDSDDPKSGDQPEATAKLRKFKAGGKEYEFTEEEILSQFESVFGKAVDYTQKTMKMAPYRKMISAIEQEGVTSEQLDLAIDALKGDKGALAKMLKLNEVDPFDLSSDDSPDYIPKQYGKNDQQLEIEETIGLISKDKEYPITVDVIDNQWDQQSRKAFADNPSMIQGLHNDIKSGLYDKVAPMAMKLKVLDGNAKKSDLEYYMIAGEQLQNLSRNTTVDKLNTAQQSAESKLDQASSEAKKKRAASITRSRSDRKGVIDFLDDNDEAFDDWYKKLQASN